MAGIAQHQAPKAERSNSISQASESSQTAQEFINSQLQLEADAREVLPYQFDTCSRPLGPLRQKLWSCLTCNPPPASPDDPYTPAGVCYSCHVSCHGEHTLVELFAKRNFVCDCGTTRIQSDCPCTLRINEKAGSKGDVRNEEPAKTNHYDHNYRNRFCGCGQDYDAHAEKGTMFQCLGLGTVEEGGCGEDWWHPECVVGLPRDWYKKDTPENTSTDTKEVKEENGNVNGGPVAAETNGQKAAQAPNGGEVQIAEGEDEPPNPPGFPEEEDFEHFICYKCVEAFPWIKRYAGSEGFLPPVFHKPGGDGTNSSTQEIKPEAPGNGLAETTAASVEDSSYKKRKASDTEDDAAFSPVKRQRNSPEPSPTDNPATASSNAAPRCRYRTLPSPPTEPLSLFLKEDFRAQLCRCPTCFPNLSPHAQLLDDEDVYEPPISSTGSSDAGEGAGSLGSRSLLDRGEAALSNMDRVRAIEGVMVYNHLKDRVKDFLKPFAESGTPVGAEDIKSYFERLRGDAEGILRARGEVEGRGDGGNGGGGGGGGGEDKGGKGDSGEGSQRREQSG